MTLGRWSLFLEFAKQVSREHLRLWGHIDGNTLEQYLSFHAIHKNLYVTQDGDGFAFLVVRPVTEPTCVFDWTQPESDLLLLDVLYSKSKKASLRLLKLYLDSGRCINNTIYHRNGKFLPWTPKLTKRFFYGIN